MNDRGPSALRIVPHSSVPQRPPKEQPPHPAPATYWSPYTSGGEGPSGMHPDPYGSAANPAWAYGRGLHEGYSSAMHSVGPHESLRKRRASTYAENDVYRVYKRKTYIPKASMNRTVAPHVAEACAHESCDSGEPVSVGVPDQYLLSNWNYSALFDLVVLNNGEYRSMGHSRVRTRRKAYCAR